MKHLARKTLHTTLLASGLILMTACGGGGGGGAGDSTAPVADTFTPEDGAVNVQLDTTVSAVFDEAMIDLSIAEDSFYLRAANGTEVNATVAYDTTNDTATLTPRKPLSLLTRYTATLTSDNLDLAGNALPETSWSFQTRDGSWDRNADTIDTRDTDASYSEIASDSDGNAIAVWVQPNDRGSSDLLANHYNANTQSWGSPIILDSQNGDVFYPKIAMNDSGKAVVIWAQRDPGSTNSIWVNHFSGRGWSIAQRVENGSRNCFHPDIAINDSGDAIAVWEQALGAHFRIHAKYYDASTMHWEDDPQVLSDDTDSSYHPKVALNEMGKAVVTWYQKDGMNGNIQAIQLTDGSWGGVSSLESLTGNAIGSEVALSSTGEGVVVWYQNEGGHYSIYANRLYRGHWQGAELLEDDDIHNASYPKVALNSTGEMIVVWKQYEGRYSHIYSSRFGHAGWSDPESLESYSGHAGSQDIVIDEEGNAMAIWHQKIGFTDHIMINRFTTDGWHGTLSIAIKGEQPTLSVNKSGKITAAWTEEVDGKIDLKARSFR